MEKKFAFLSGGKLFLKDTSDKPAEHVSEFGKEMISRAQRIHQNRSWKARDEESDFLSSRSLWGVKPQDPNSLKVHITAVESSINANEIIYALSTSVVGGLFLHDNENKKERRLFHKEGMIISDLSRHPEKDDFVCSLRNEDGTSFIAMVGKSQCDQITEGDCLDEAPSWIPNKSNSVLYQSAGIGRNSNGVAVGLSSYSIQKLDIESGEIEEVLGSNKYDYLLPKMNDREELFFIRRPYLPFGKPTSSGTILKDIVFFPFRLGKAFLAFLNFFSLTFTKQPLTSDGNERAKGMELDKIFLRGRMIDAKEIMNSNKINKEEAPIVPPDWELVKRQEDGTETVIAKSVVDYNLDSERNIFYTNGRAVYQIEEDKSKLLFKSNLIESLSILNT